MIKKKAVFICSVFVGILFLAACQPDLYPSRNAVTQIAELPVRKADLKYAKGFSITYYKTFKQVNVYNYEGKRIDTAQYLLIKRGGLIPDGFPKAQVIETPVRSIIGMSSMHVALIDFAEADGILTGLGNLKYASSVK
ncbi:MAG: hypothetical protein MUP99_07360, partial [Pedobacter sp.]|nr:hypothetical protein [Pedobacter sp.]